jgi:hypothetical protein
MIKPSRPDSLVSQVAEISRSDRWFVSRRLQELTINCWCPEDGSLWVEIDNSTHAVLLRSAVYQLMASRQELIDWLERCWDEQ